MTGEAFGRGDGKGALAEDARNGSRLDRVSGRGGRGVGMDVVDLGWVNTRMSQRALHRADGSRAAGIGEVVSVASEGIAENLSVNRRPACPRRVQRLQDQRCAAPR